MTVTVAIQVTEPPVLVAVPVKVVSAFIAGVVVDPLGTGTMFPMPVSILKVVAFDVVQERTDEAPVATEVGAAVSAQTGAVGVGVDVDVEVGVDVGVCVGVRIGVMVGVDDETVMVAVHNTVSPPVPVIVLV